MVGRPSAKLLSGPVRGGLAGRQGMTPAPVRHTVGTPPEPLQSPLRATRPAVVLNTGAKTVSAGAANGTG
jgi:hypothetical protein